jgi:MobA/MobL family
MVCVDALGTKRLSTYRTILNKSCSDPYNARTQLYREADRQTTKDYSRHGEILFSGIFAPKDAPDWTRDRQELWNRAEGAERQRTRNRRAMCSRPSPTN